MLPHDFCVSLQPASAFPHALISFRRRWYTPFRRATHLAPHPQPNTLRSSGFDIMGMKDLQFRMQSGAQGNVNG